MAKRGERLAFLTNEEERNKTFNNKKKNIIKELSEPKIIHEIKACVILSKLYALTPEIWPSSKVAFDKLLQLAEVKQRKDQDSYMKKVIQVAKEMSKKKRKENTKKEKTLCLFEDLKVREVPKDLGKNELKEYLKLVDEQMKKIEVLMYETKKVEATQNKSKVVAPPMAKVDDSTTKYKRKGVVVVESRKGLEMIMDAINEIEVKEMFD